MFDQAMEIVHTSMIPPWSKWQTFFFKKITIGFVKVKAKVIKSEILSFYKILRQQMFWVFNASLYELLITKTGDNLRLELKVI